LKEITAKHNDLESNLSIIQHFMENFKERFVFFQSLIEDKKNLEEKYFALEVKFAQTQNVYNEKEIIHLREQLFILSSELELKNKLVKKYEDTNHKKGLGLVKTKKTEKEHGKAEGKFTIF